VIRPCHLLVAFLRDVRICHAVYVARTQSLLSNIGVQRLTCDNGQAYHPGQLLDQMMKVVSVDVGHVE
jgi:hypothetical protein